MNLKILRKFGWLDVKHCMYFAQRIEFDLTKNFVKLNLRSFICIWFDGKFREIEYNNLICIWFDGKIREIIE